MKIIRPLALILFAAPAAWAAAPKAYKPDANAPRSSVPEEYRWDLTNVFKDAAAWEAGFADAKGRLAAISGYKGSLTTAPAARACLDDYFALRGVTDRIASYANHSAVVDDGVSGFQESQQRSLALQNDFRSGTSFIRQELLRLDDRTANAMLGDASLAPYRAYILDLRRRRAHVLGEEAERVLGIAGDNLWSETDLDEMPSEVELIFKAVTKDIQLPKIKDEQGGEVQLTLANYNKYRASSDPRVRRETVDAFFGALKKY